ncbi:MAG: ABC transporter ATP-binding protein, partial [Blastocatellia bacterium]
MNHTIELPTPDAGRPDQVVASSPARPVAIRIDSLTKRYGDVIAVDRLSLEVPTGRMFGFLGPNGAGKSTT